MVSSKDKTCDNITMKRRTFGRRCHTLQQWHMYSRNPHHNYRSNIIDSQFIGKGDIIIFPIKYRLLKTLIFFILLYGYETWTLLAETETKIQFFATKC